MKKEDKVMPSSGQNLVFGLLVGVLWQEIQTKRTSLGCSSNLCFENLD